MGAGYAVRRLACGLGGRRRLWSVYLRVRGLVHLRCSGLRLCY